MKALKVYAQQRLLDAEPLLLWPAMNDRCHSIARPHHLRGVAIMLAALCLLAVPVSYTGGHEATHPHAILQLVVDVSHGATNHHSPQPDHAGAHHEAPIHRTRVGAVPDDASTVGLPSGFTERLTALAPIIGFGLLVATLWSLPLLTVVSRLVGIRSRPLIPPPRLAV